MKQQYERAELSLAGHIIFDPRSTVVCGLTYTAETWKEKNTKRSHTVKGRGSEGEKANLNQLSFKINRSK